MELLKLNNLCITGAEHTPVTDSSTGEICCRSCGVVMSDNLLVNENSFDSAKSQHYPVSYKMGDKGLGSIFTGNGSSGKKLTNAQRSIRVGGNQTKGLIEFSKISGKLNLPSYVIEEATKSFIYIRKEGFLKGREVNTIVGACVYLFAKKNGLNLTFKEISQKLSINRKTLFSYYTDLIKVLDIDFSDIKVSLPVDYFEQLCSNFNFDIKLKNSCLKVVKDMQNKQYHAGKNPTAVCAAGIYIGCVENHHYITQNNLSVVSGISEVTIRNISKKFIELY